VAQRVPNSIPPAAPWLPVGVQPVVLDRCLVDLVHRPTRRLDDSGCQYPGLRQLPHPPGRDAQGLGRALRVHSYPTAAKMR